MPLFLMLLLLPSMLDKCETCKGNGKLDCSECHGDWKAIEQEVVCEREGGSGCDGRGWRDCFECKGKGEVDCEKCAGDGKVKTSRKEGHKHIHFTIGCRVCGGEDRKDGKPGTGRQDCKKCEPAYRCVKCSRIYAKQMPEGAACECSGSTYERVGFEKLDGQVKCQKCKGAGKLKKKVKCPACDKGRVDCPDC